MNPIECWDKLQNYGKFNRPEGLLTKEQKQEIKDMKNYFQDKWNSGSEIEKMVARESTLQYNSQRLTERLFGNEEY